MDIAEMCRQPARYWGAVFQQNLGACRSALWAVRPGTLLGGDRTHPDSMVMRICKLLQPGVGGADNQAQYL